MERGQSWREAGLGAGPEELALGVKAVTEFLRVAAVKLQPVPAVELQPMSAVELQRMELELELERALQVETENTNLQGHEGR